MKTFSDLGIKPSRTLFVGDKIKIAKVLNKKITVMSYKIEKSKYPKNKSGDLLTIQINHEGANQIIFTGSEVLMDQIKQVAQADMPFETIIIKNGEHFEFS
jgi:hypothetical protein